ncbi:MAG: amidohydrolase [Bacteroidetes bacterium]|nr:amidohydrolase [Bacteroidota bacterium]
MKSISIKYSLHIFSCSLLLLLMLDAKSQSAAPAAPQTKSILIANATAHIGNGQVIENSLIGIKNSLIEFVYDATTVRIADLKFDTIIQAQGKHVYPGLIAMNTNIGLSEIEMVRATNDYSETGDLNSSARSAIAYNTDSKVTPTIRSNGVLLAQVVPQGGMVSGTSSVFKLDGWNWEDALYKEDDALHMYWPQMTVQRGWWAAPEEEQREKMRKEIDHIKKLFIDAKVYCNAAVIAEPNLNLQAMCEVIKGNRKLYVHAQHVKQITSAVNFCNEYKINMVLVGGDDAWRLAPLLKENNIPVVITRTQQLPSRQDEDIDIWFKMPAILKKLE